MYLAIAARKVQDGQEAYDHYFQLTLKYLGRVRIAQLSLDCGRGSFRGQAQSRIVEVSTAVGRGGAPVTEQTSRQCRLSPLMMAMAEPPQQNVRSSRPPSPKARVPARPENARRGKTEPNEVNRLGICYSRAPLVDPPQCNKTNGLLRRSAANLRADQQPWSACANRDR